MFKLAEDEGIKSSVSNLVYIEDLSEVINTWVKQHPGIEPECITVYPDNENGLRLSIFWYE